MHNHTTLKTLLLAALPAAGLCLWSSMATADPKPGDKHYNKIGFFDIHVCNWPNQPLFLMPLVSTAYYEDIEKVDVFYPDGRQLAELDLSRFRTLEPKDGPKKQVFINQLGMPDDAVEGWYSAMCTAPVTMLYSPSWAGPADSNRHMKRPFLPPLKSSAGTRSPGPDSTRCLSATSGMMTS